MKKIIAAFDGLKYAENTAACALHLAKRTQTHLVGVFPDDMTYTSYLIHELVVKKGITADQLKKYEERDAKSRKQSVEKFEKVCKQEGIQYSLHQDKKVAIQCLKHESIYADLLVISMKETFSHYPEKPPTRFIRDLLSDTQCPVLLVPEKYKGFEKVVLLYDGEPSSVYAIKMFSYLLPELADIPTEVISVNPANKSLHLPDNKLMKEFMKRHYPGASYTILKGMAEEAIVKKLKEQDENTLVVLGAYRRGAVSRWFRESMADVLMKEVRLPLFIAHNK
ncbi:MAG TPA: universal stress protein [Chitinophagaceae bacterium]|nr:universal stress protein [Chitinophagaceae bacterium]